MMKHDWAGEWYTIARERGVNDSACLGLAHCGSQTVQWLDFSHIHHDGVGGFCMTLKELGATNVKWPERRRASKAQAKSKWQIFKTGLLSLKPAHPPWKAKQVQFLKPDVHKFDWIIFTEKETEFLYQYTKTNNISLHALFLYWLQETALNELMNHPLKGSWLFPVNMRGMVEPERYKQNPMGNFSSGIPIAIDGELTAQQYQRKISKGMADRLHFSTWAMLQVGKYIGKSGMRYFSKRSQNKSFWIGSFTNMGRWPIEGTEIPSYLKDTQSAWICSPPGTANYPLSVGVITWYNRLSISLKIHPSILKNQEDDLSSKVIQRIYQHARGLFPAELIEGDPQETWIHKGSSNPVSTNGSFKNSNHDAQAGLFSI